MCGEVERKALVTRFKATFPLSRLRRTLVGRCERMCADELDQSERCDCGRWATEPWETAESAWIF